MAAQHHATTMAYTKGARVDDRRRASGATKEEWSNKGEKERAQREKPKMDRNRLAALKKDKKEVSVLHHQWLLCTRVPTRQPWALPPSALRDQGCNGTLCPSPLLPLRIARTRNPHGPVPVGPNEGRRSLVGVALALAPGEVVRALSRLLLWRPWSD